MQVVDEDGGWLSEAFLAQLEGEQFDLVVLGRAEAFASRNRVWHSLVDAVGTGIGFTMAIFCMGAIREVLGSGTFAGIDLFGDRAAAYDAAALQNIVAALLQE